MELTDICVCVAFKLQAKIQAKTKIMASSPITSWQIDGETVKRVTIFLDSKITADSDRSHEIKRHFLLGRKAMINLESVLKIETLLCQLCNKGTSSQSYGFSSSHVQK